MRNRLLLSGIFTALLVSSAAFAQDDTSAFEPADGAPATTEAPAAAPEAPAAAPTTSPVLSGPDTASYDLQLHELEDRLNELKESVFASKARLSMLWHQLMQERIGGSRIVIEHVNRLGGLFDIERITYSLDGNQVYVGNVADMPELPRENRIDVFDAPVLAGPHTIVVQATLVGNDHGMFSYMSGYEFTLTSSHSFTLEDGKTAEVDVIVFDHGGSSRALEDRPDVRYDVDFSDTVGDDVSAISGDEGEDL